MKRFEFIGAKIKSLSAALFFGGIVLTIMAPLWRPGYLFLLDMVWGPGPALAQVWYGPRSIELPWNLIFAVLRSIISSSWVEKFVLTLILFIIPWNMFRLLRLNMPFKLSVLGATIYLLNPYVYERFIAGQWLVLAGYGFFPLVIAFFFFIFMAKILVTSSYLCKSSRNLPRH